MIVNPDKGLFFVVTALMCSASLYGAELSTTASDPMTRVFVGEPNRLTLPPGFPATEIAAETTGCGLESQVAQVREAQAPLDLQNTGCASTAAENAADRFARPAPLGVAGAKSLNPLQPISVGAAERLH